MKVDIRTLRIQAKLLEALDNLKKYQLNIEGFIITLIEIEKSLEAYIDNSFQQEQKLIRILMNLIDALSDEVYLYWYDKGFDDITECQLVPTEVSKEIQKTFSCEISNLEKFILRNIDSCEDVSERERIAWWLKYQEREMDELCDN